MSVYRVTNKQEIEQLFNKYDNLIIQEFINGKEYGVDVYVDMISGDTISIFIKKKIKMRAGETDKSVSVKNEELFGLIKNYVKKAKFKGIIDIDIFEKNETFYISEVIRDLVVDIHTHSKPMLMYHME